MNEPDIKVKQQIVEKIKSSSNILITVSRNPSVDDLSAALGLTVLLNKLEKHGTAIFSGDIPPAIEFLEPEKTFESTVDSLRDFIIALDKEKADHLRYKIEGDFVKIYITPYRMTITGDDLEFSQGDFNVELVIALGVESQNDLDSALAAHGRILHDVTVATFTAGQKVSRLGSLDWHDENASSLSEMVTSISEALKGDKPILDKQIATALLTGIVAATDRFSNSKTSSRIMTMAAQLMAAGADQQLIASKLQESHTINVLPDSKEGTKDDKKDIAEEPKVDEVKPDVAEPLGDTGVLEVEHDIDKATIGSDASEADKAKKAIEEALAQSQPVDDKIAQTEITAPPIAAELSQPAPVEPIAQPPVVAPIYEQQQSTDQLNDDHSFLDGSGPGFDVSMNSFAARPSEGSGDVNIFADDKVPSFISNDGIDKVVQPISTEPTADTNQLVTGDTLRAQLTEPPADLPMPPPLPDFSTLPPPPPPVDAGLPPTAPLTDMSTLASPPTDQDPGQFKIPN